MYNILDLPKLNRPPTPPLQSLRESRPFSSLPLVSHCLSLTVLSLRRTSSLPSLAMAHPLSRLSLLCGRSRIAFLFSCYSVTLSSPSFALRVSSSLFCLVGSSGGKMSWRVIIVSCRDTLITRL